MCNLETLSAVKPKEVREQPWNDDLRKLKRLNPTGDENRGAFWTKTDTLQHKKQTEGSLNGHFLHSTQLHLALNILQIFVHLLGKVIQTYSNHAKRTQQSQDGQALHRRAASRLRAKSRNRLLLGLQEHRLPNLIKLVSLLKTLGFFSVEDGHDWWTIMNLMTFP